MNRGALVLLALLGLTGLLAAQKSGPAAGGDAGSGHDCGCGCGGRRC